MFTDNDVLIKHNDDILTYAVDSIGNRKFQIYLDIYRSTFLNAEQRKDSQTCSNIVNDIVNTICAKSVPNGRFLQFDEKKNIWYDVGTGAIPCQRARTGLLGLYGKTTSNEYHADKPIVEMSKTMRARTMKALHFSEKQRTAVINLNDDRFKLKEQLFTNHASCTPQLEKKPSYKRPREKHVAFSESVTKGSKINFKDGKLSKRRKITSREVQHVDVTCGGTGEGILNIDTPGNRLFHSLINARMKNYTISDDKDKFKEVCDVINLMQHICPSCRFVEEKGNPDDLLELSFQDIMEKTIQAFCNPFTHDDLSATEIENFITSIENKEIYDTFISDTLNDAPDNVKHVDNKALKIKDENPDDIFSSLIIEEKKMNSNKVIRPVEDYLKDENASFSCSQEQVDYLDVLFPEVTENINETTAAEEFLESILVTSQ